VAHKTVVIVQSSYIPWKGYFDLVNRADELILLDDVQFTVRDWRNRNRIKTPQGLAWLTIPVKTRGRRLQAVQNVEIADPGWNRRHWRTLQHAYRRAPHFRTYRGLFEELYLGCSETRLSAVNRRFLGAVCDLLRISTAISWSADYGTVAGKSERLVGLCRQAGADRYLSGPRARAYLDETLFAAEGIEVEYADYQGYLEYNQLGMPFVHQVSIVDLLFCTGPDARSYLKST